MAASPAGRPDTASRPEKTGPSDDDCPSGSEVLAGAVEICRERPDEFVTAFPRMLKLFFSHAGSGQRKKFYRMLAKRLKSGEQTDEFIGTLLKRLPASRAVRYGELVTRVEQLHYAKAEISVALTTLAEFRSAVDFCVRRPGVISWIEQIPPDGVFYDVGAWIGITSLVASARDDGCHTTIAFEPAYYNFFALCENVHFNGYMDRITPLNVALDTSTSMADFQYRTMERGATENSLGEARNRGGNPFRPVAQQRIMTMTLDDAIRHFRLAFPTHLKIDTDGSELAVVAGGKGCLANPLLRSVLVSVCRPGADEQLRRSFEGLGWRLTNSTALTEQEQESEPAFLQFDR